MKYANNILLFRSIRRELARMLKNSHIQDTNTTRDNATNHILSLMRDNQVTENRFCRPKDHYKYFAETYLTYLKSSRLEDELIAKYYNKGDRSIKESARLVGLELPKLKNPN